MVNKKNGKPDEFVHRHGNMSIESWRQQYFGSNKTMYEAKAWQSTVRVIPSKNDQTLEKHLADDKLFGQIKRCRKFRVGRRKSEVWNTISRKLNY